MMKENLAYITSTRKVKFNSNIQIQIKEFFLIWPSKLHTHQNQKRHIKPIVTEICIYHTMNFEILYTAQKIKQQWYLFLAKNGNRENVNWIYISIKKS